MKPCKTFTLFLCGFLMAASPASVFAIPSEGHKIQISAPSPYAVEVGKKIHEMGGNVVDVAVAAALSIAVTTPYYAALGGGGFALVKMGDSEIEALDFRETAPAATSPNYYADGKSSRSGGTAVGVPGNPMGYYELHKKYGKLSWKSLFALPIQLANDGFEVSGDWVKKTGGEKDRFNSSGLRFLFKNSKDNYLPGEKLKQPQLARALRLFRDQGVKGFYSGEVAKDIVQTVQQAKGHLALEDLKSYKVRWLKPMEHEFKGHKIFMMPPPSSGGVVISQALSLIEMLNLEKHAFLSVDELHLLTEIHSRAYRGRALLGDPDFHKNPLEQLLNPAEIKKLANGISLKKASTLPPLKEEIPKESTETTHLTVMDSKGNTVTLTTTLNGNYGSAVVSNIYGIALNNEMDDFTTEPEKPNMFGLIQGFGNRVEPGKRPLSSMTPTIVMKDGETVLALGAPGGPRIISAVLQVIYRVIGQDMDLDMAVQAPRVYHQFLPNIMFVDRQRLSPEVLTALKKRGHEIKESWIAKVYAVQRNKDGLLKSAFDSRGEGAAGGF